MDGYLPIVYVRGYAATEGAIEQTVDLPYYGFNLGSTRVRTSPEGHPRFLIFESPLVRLIKDHQYTDVFARIGSGGDVELLNSEDERYRAKGFPMRSLWVYRYYDRTSEWAGDGTRDEIETLGEDLGTLVDFVLEKTGAPKVYLVAHSMGGLICRSLIQRVLKENAVKKIARLFTYATPHRGIHFRRGLGFLSNVRDLLGFCDSDTFGPKRMREYLGFPNDWDEERLNEIGYHYPPALVFSLVGTNHEDYNLARLIVGPGSDGLVQKDNAFVKGSSRAFVYRSHSGPLGIVNSEEGYQNLQRFLFGDTSVQIDLANLRLKETLRNDEELKFLLIEISVVIRGEDILMTDQREEQGSPLTVGASALETTQTALFRTYLMKSRRPTAQDRYSNFQIRLRILPHYVRDRIVLREHHYFGEHILQDVLTVGIRDQDDQKGRLIRCGWTSLESELPRAATRYANTDNIRFKLRSRNLERGEVVLRVRGEGEGRRG